VGTEGVVTMAVEMAEAEMEKAGVETAMGAEGTMEGEGMVGEEAVGEEMGAAGTASTLAHPEEAGDMEWEAVREVALEPASR